MSSSPKVITPAIHELGRRNAWETGARPITVEEAYEIAHRVYLIEPHERQCEAISKEIAAIVSKYDKAIVGVRK